jgi:hypothetical protein
MAYLYSYEIGTTYAGRANIESLSAVPLMATRSKFLAYAEPVQMASGVSVGRGFPIAIWQFAYIYLDFHAALRIICPGASKAVTIRTLKADYSTYGYYTGIMHWPALDTYEYKDKKYSTFELRFTHLVVYTP